MPDHPPVQEGPPGPRPNPILQLTLMRLRELWREPGVVFWVFGFPILIAVALGLAFRSQAPQPPVVGALPGVPAEVRAALEAAGVEVRPLDPTAARVELRSGRVALLLVPPAQAGGALGYRFDPVRPEARLGRATVDAILQKAAGRRDPRLVRDDTVSEPGARYIDFLIPGLIGMNLMSGSMWGIGWTIVNMRVRKLLKRLLAAPMRRSHLLYAQALARLVLLPFEAGVIILFAWLAFDVRVNGSWLALAIISLVGAAQLRLDRHPGRQPRPEPGVRQRPDEPGDDADVRALGRLLLGHRLPPGHAADHRRAPPDRPQRRPPRRDDRRRLPDRHPPPPRRDGRLGHRRLHPGPPPLPLALTAACPAATPREVRPRQELERVYTRVYTSEHVRAGEDLSEWRESSRAPAKSCRFSDDQDEVLVRRVGKQIILEPADEWPVAFLECLGSWKEDIPRPPTRSLGGKKDPFDPS